MNTIINLIEKTYYFLWGDWIHLPLPGGTIINLPLLVLLLVPTGIFCTIRTRFLQIRMLPDMLRALLEKGVDERTIELLRAMFEQHGQVNKRLSGLNLLGKRIIPQLSRAFILLNDALTLIRDYQTVEFTPKGLERFHLFLHDQARVRADLLEPVVSPACRETVPKH